MAKKPGKGKAVTTAAIFKALGATQPYLGNARAVVIVCTCANTSPGNLGRTLEQLGVKGGPFQVCVFKGVTTCGYAIAIETIPNSQDTRLIDVVNVIQDAPRAATRSKQK